MNHDQLVAASIEEVGEQILRLIETDGFLVSEVVDLLLQKAVLTRCSDIHLEPVRRSGREAEKGWAVRIRYRIDGAFHRLVELPIDLLEKVVSRIKVMSDLLSHRKDIVQEGRISLNTERGRTDLRVSVVPTVAGEKVVIRIFTVSDAMFDLSSVGYDASMLHQIKANVFDLQGLFLLTGPSGAGKTTTLYAILHEIQREMDDYASIITIEDPVEYECGLWSQMQVSRKNEFTFAAGLKASLRQDPQVIMVGEIRDIETAEVALRAGLTGHMVLSTLHSGSAPETVTRLINMDLEPFVVASALSGTIAQRLVRAICPDCKKPVELDESRTNLVRRLGNFAEDEPLGEFFDAAGCEGCNFTGYHNRLPVAEFLSVDEDIRNLILDKARTTTIRNHLLSQGWRTLLEDGLRKAAQGKTTFEEIMRNVSLREVQ